MMLAKGFRHAPLTGYFALTFAWSWACWALSPAVKPQLPWLATLLMFAGSFGPSLAAVVVVASTRKWLGLRAWLGRCLRWRIGWAWWAFALLLPLAVMSIAAGLHIALGGAIATSPASGHLLMTLVNLPLILLLGGPLGEEFGWRGYALPVLQERWGWRRAVPAERRGHVRLVRVAGPAQRGQRGGGIGAAHGHQLLADRRAGAAH
jgi:hypothetical protein